MPVILPTPPKDRPEKKKNWDSCSTRMWVFKVLLSRWCPCCSGIGIPSFTIMKSTLKCTCRKRKTKSHYVQLERSHEATQLLLRAVSDCTQRPRHTSSACCTAALYIPSCNASSSSCVCCLLVAASSSELLVFSSE